MSSSQDFYFYKKALRVVIHGALPSGKVIAFRRFLVSG
ncbi:hypothetical protein CpE55_1039 [Corynebacterium pseudotuberculosis]|nr:hypothetical protein CpE55_1039 [Corynebacterium pseudotuberculosis]